MNNQENEFTRLKERFIEESIYDEKTSKTYLTDLKKIQDTEEYFNKHLFNFTYEQIEEALSGLQFKKVASIVRAVSTYRTYANWANKNGFIKSKSNTWELFTSDKVENYIWEHAINNSFILREEIYNIINKVDNALDIIPILLCFEGVYGKKMEEMINLKFSDINFETGEMILTRNDGTMRNIIIEDKRLLNIIKDSQYETIYYKKNYRSDSANINIVITPYVIRKVAIKTSKGRPSSDGVFYGNEKAGLMTIEARFTKIFRGNRGIGQGKDPLIEGFSFLNATNVFKSGYFDYCSQLEKEIGELKTSHYEQACLRYGIKPILALSYKKQYLDWKRRKQIQEQKEKQEQNEVK